MPFWLSLWAATAVLFNSVNDLFHLHCNTINRDTTETPTDTYGKAVVGESSVASESCSPEA